MRTLKKPHCYADNSAATAKVINERQDTQSRNVSTLGDGEYLRDQQRSRESAVNSIIEKAIAGLDVTLEDAIKQFDDGDLGDIESGELDAKTIRHAVILRLTDART